MGIFLYINLFVMNAQKFQLYVHLQMHYGSFLVSFLKTAGFTRLCLKTRNKNNCFGKKQVSVTAFLLCARYRDHKPC